MLIKDDILWFQVPVFDIKFWMEVTECQNDLYSYELNLILIEPPIELQVIE